jgi:hypothetical protein
MRVHPDIKRLVKIARRGVQRAPLGRLSHAIVGLIALAAIAAGGAPAQAGEKITQQTANAQADNAQTANLQRTDHAAKAAPALSREYLVKAALLYNFAKFTEWPDAAFADPAAPLRMCVLGRDPFGPALNAIAGKPIAGRTVAISRLAGVDGITDCQVLFISRSERDRLDAILERLDGRPILTVADMPEFSRDSGIINLKIVAERIRFEVNVAVAEHAGLSFSSKLLVLAERISKTAGIETWVVRNQR